MKLSEVKKCSESKRMDPLPNLSDATSFGPTVSYLPHNAEPMRPTTDIQQ